MKLNEYIYKKLNDINVLREPIRALTPGDIERWIVDWYMGEFNEAGCDVKDTARVPPLWLANRREYGVDEC